MRNILFLSIFLVGCSPTEWKVADDIIEGEINTVEKVAQDLTGTDLLQGKQKPKVELTVPVKKF